MFHTVEGGAVVCKDSDVANKLRSLRNFGHKGQEDFHGLGINAKMSEFHAAMGLTVLPYLSSIIQSRKEAVEGYIEKLEIVNIEVPILNFLVSTNYSYFPILFKSESDLLKARDALNEDGVYPRRYFYPSLNQLPYIENHLCSNSEDISSRVLCLPLYNGITKTDIKIICDIINIIYLQ